MELQEEAKPLEEKKPVLVKQNQFEKTELENVFSKDEGKTLEIKPDYEETNESVVEEIKKEKIETLLPVKVEEVLTSQLEPKVEMIVAEESELNIRPVEVEEIVEQIHTIEEPKEVLQQEKVQTVEKPKDEVLQQEQVQTIVEPKEEVLEQKQVQTVEEPKDEVLQQEQVQTIVEPKEEVLEQEQVQTIVEPKGEVLEEGLMDKMEPIIVIETEESPEEETLPIQKDEIIEQVQLHEQLEKEIIQVSDDQKDEKEQIQEMLNVGKHIETIPVIDLANEIKTETIEDKIKFLKKDNTEAILNVHEKFQITTDLDSFLETKNAKSETELTKKTPIEQKKVFENILVTEQPIKDIKPIQEDIKVELAKENKEQVEDQKLFDNINQQNQDQTIAAEEKQQIEKDKLKKESYEIDITTIESKDELSAVEEIKNEREESLLPVEVEKISAQILEVEDGESKDIQGLKEEAKVEMLIAEGSELDIRPVEVEEIVEQIQTIVEPKEDFLQQEQVQKIEEPKEYLQQEKFQTVEEPKEDFLQQEQVQTVEEPKDEVLQQEQVQTSVEPKEEVLEEGLMDKMEPIIVIETEESPEEETLPIQKDEIIEQVQLHEQLEKEIIQVSDDQKDEKEQIKEMLNVGKHMEEVLEQEQVQTMEEPKEEALQQEEQIEIEPIKKDDQVTEITEQKLEELDDSKENEKLALDEYPIDIVEVHLEPEQEIEIEPREKSTENLIPIEQIELKTVDQETELVIEVLEENDYVQKEKFSELIKEVQISEKITGETKKHHAVEKPEVNIQKEEQMPFVYDQLVIDEPKVDLIENGFVIVNDIPELSDDQISEKPPQSDHKSDQFKLQISDENIFTDDFITEILSPKYDQTESLFDTTLPEPSKISMENLFFANQPVRDELLEQMIYDLTETKCEPLPKSLSIKTEFTLTPVNTPEIDFKKPNFHLQKQPSFDQVSQLSEIKIDLTQSQDSQHKSDRLETKTSSTESLSNLISELNQSIQVYKSQELSTEIGNDDEVANKATKVAESITLEQTVDDLIDEFGNFRFKPSSKRPSLKKRRDSKLAPKFSQTLVDQQFKRDDNLHLDCYVEGEQPIKVEWFQNKTALGPTKNIEIYRELGVCSLEIIKASEQTEGEFKCQASNKHGHDATACTLTMIGTETPVFSELLRDQCVELESEVFLDCTVKNKRPGDTIQWYVDAHKILPSSNVEIFAELGICSLQIRKMSAELQGFYCCKVHDANDAVIAQTGCRLAIKHQPFSLHLVKDEIKLSSSFKKIPFFVNELSSCVTIREGDSLCLFCRLNTDCEPKPSIIWIKDGSVIKSGKYFDLVYSEASGECRLLADTCEKKKFEGTYTCVATFPDSQTDLISKTSCQVKIISYKEMLEAESNLEDGLESDSLNRGIPPMFLQALKDTVCEEGDDLELMCQIMGAPLPDVVCYFTKDITDKSAMKKVKQELLSYNCETGICRVVIKNVSFYTNDGFYIIKAVNDAGSLNTACQVKIKLKSYPLLNLESDVEPVFTTQLPSRITVMDGQEICLTCICSAKPEPSIEWFKSSLNDQETFSQVVYTNDIRSCFDSTTGKCTLKINDTYPQDAGTYKCIASNSLGQAETMTRLAVETFVYEPDSEEASFNVDMSESDGTITPTSKKFETYSEYESDSISINKQLSQSLTGSEYFTANSGFTTDSAASSTPVYIFKFRIGYHLKERIFLGNLCDYPAPYRFDRTFVHRTFAYLP
ncbi:titin isoform X5 [Brachionus plicatilis]|uniref:Titin isoform X5 n=1 Tax=Brachionus plicatilis TaxID=10195 RepID=A0A3M7REH3_BRAPC|nr:titin isoform X5 [Brachionus plicatilis]